VTKQQIKSLGGARQIEKRARAKYARDGHEQPAGAEIKGDTVSLYNRHGSLASYRIVPTGNGFRLIGQKNLP